MAVEAPEATQQCKPIKVMTNEIEAVGKPSKPFGTHFAAEDDMDDDMIATYDTQAW